jgi:hypothetical protein
MNTRYIISNMWVFIKIFVIFITLTSVSLFVSEESRNTNKTNRN